MIIPSQIWKKVKRHKALISVVVVTVTVTILNIQFILKYAPAFDCCIKTNISCHYLDNNGVLPQLGEGYKPQPRSIFFHETSCEGNFTSRQACAVESAARAHPDWHVHVVFSSPISEKAVNTGSLKALKSIKNVKLMRVDIREYAVGTPLEGLVLEGALNKSNWRVEHTSDVLRYLTLYKWGGVYMDLDVVVVRSIASLARNWAARASAYCVASDILAFSRDAVGRNIADVAIRDLSTKFRGDLRYNNGPGVITRVLKEICSTNQACSMSSATCNGFEVYGPQFFYPVDNDDIRLYFKPGNLDIQNAYVHHLSSYISSSYKIQKGSPYAKLARKYCPTIYNIYGDDFGN